MAKKKKWTIRKKFFISFCLLFVIAATVFAQLMVTNLHNNTMKAMEEDLEKLQNLTTEYIRQQKEIDPITTNILEQNAVEIATKLGQLNKQSVAIFNEKGEFQYEYIPIESTLLMSQNRYHPDLALDEKIMRAYENQAVYELEEVENGTILVFTFPIYIYGEQLGVVRFTNDYTKIMEQNDELLLKMSLLTIVLFIGVFLISSILINKITKPLAILNDWTKKVVKGQYDESIKLSSNDEIGELATSFKEMQVSIKEYIHQLEEDKKKIVELERARTQFFHQITHELKTPLTTISGYAQIIGEEDFNDREFLQVAANRINNESKRLHDLVTAILDSTKYANTPKSNFSLQTLLEEVIHDLSSQAYEKQMDFNVIGNNIEVYGVKEEWRRICINLLENSVKYGKETSIITINMTNGLTIQNEMNQLHAQTIDRLFEAFNYSRRQDSHGLGLYIVKQLVEKNKASIEANIQKNIFEIKITFNNLETSN